MSEAVLKGVLAAFSPRGHQFALTTGDGRLKTWDVTSGHLSAEFNEIAADGISELKSKGHLGLEYKSLAWGAVPSGTKKSKKKASLLTLGTGGGDVLAWDPVLGELKWRTNDCNSGGVNSLSFVKGQESCFCAGADGMVCELSIASGEILSKFRASKSAVTSISLSQDGSKLLAASSELKLFDMSTRKRKRKFTGHGSSVTATAFTGDGAYALSAAAGDRYVAVWDCEGSEKGAKMVLNMEHPAVALDSWGFGKDGKELKILAVSEVGEAYIWSGMNLEELQKALPVRISVGSGGKGKLSRQSVILGRLAGSDSVLVARGATVKPSFETVSLTEEGGNIVLSPQQGSLLTSQPDKSVEKSVGNEVTILGADNAADASHMRTRVESEDVKKRKRRASEEAEKIWDEAQKVDEMDVSPTAAEDNDEQTMEERLMALGLVEDRRSEENASEIAEIVPPKSDSLDVLLTQALQSDDSNLLEQCLAVSEEKVIANTVRRLSPVDACTLLRITISKLEARPRRGLQLVPWIRTVLLEHSTFIMSSHSVQPVLTVLYQIIEARMDVFRPLLALSGRLDLIMARIHSSETLRQSEEIEVAAAVYEEDDSDEDVEDAMENEEDEEEEEEPQDDAMQEDKTTENGGSFWGDDDGTGED